MKQTLSFLAFLLIACQPLVAQYFFTQYFDGADTVFDNSINITIDPDTNNIWQIGKPQKPIFNAATSLPNVIVTDTINSYPPNNVSRFYTKMYAWTNSGIFAWQWKQKLDMNPNHTGGMIEFSQDQGQTWQNVFNNPYVYNFYGFLPNNQDTLPTGEYVFSGTDSTWRDIWLCLDFSWVSISPDTVYFRFSFISDSSNIKKEGWMIDNMNAHATMIHTAVSGQHFDKYLNVYPNPTSDLLFIEAQKIQGFHIIENMQLIDNLGNIVEEWKNIPTKFFIKTQKYPGGLYRLRIKTNIEEETFPIIIERK